MNDRIKTQILLDYGLVIKVSEKYIVEKYYTGLDETYQLTEKGEKVFGNIATALYMVEKYGLKVKDLI